VEEPGSHASKAAARWTALAAAGEHILDPLDKELEKRGLAFVRYADDIAIFVSSQRSAERVKESVIPGSKST